MNPISRFWRRLKLLYVFLLPIRFSILALAVASFAFILADQGRDIIRRLGEVDPAIGSAHWGRIAVALLLVNLLGYQIWFWARTMLRVEPPASEDDRYFGRTPNPEEEDFRTWALWIPRVLGALLFVAMFYAFFKVRCTYGDQVKTVNHLILLLIAVSFVIFLVVVVFRRRWLQRTGGASIAHVERSGVARSTKVILAIFLVLELVLFIVTTVQPTSFMGFGAGAMVLLTLSLWVPFGSVIVYAGIKMRVPILTFLLVLAFLVSPLADHNHKIRTVPTPKAMLDARPTADQQLLDWYNRVSPNYPGGGEIPVFIVATEGGGIRAAYWTAAVLDSLQDTNPLFRRNLFAISSVSGGSLGSVVFNALLSETSLAGSAPQLHTRGSKMLGDDFLTPALGAMTQSDFIQRFLPFGFPDRERALEEAWEVGYWNAVGTPTFRNGLLDLYAKNKDLPSVFINGTMVETGDRIITSNCRIRPLTPPGPNDPPSPLAVFRNAYDGFDLLGSDIPLSSAAGMSARFTYVSPAGRIPGPSGDIGHVVDGGYFENSGAVTAAELVLLVNTISQRNGWRLVPIVLLIDYENCSPNRKDCAGEGDLTKLARDCSFDDYGPFPVQKTEGPTVPAAAETWANEVLSPVRALAATRGARGQQAVGDIRTTSSFSSGLQALAAPPATTVSGLPTVLEFRLVQRSVPMPLGWVLSYQSQAAIDGGVESKGNRWSRDTIGKWLKAGPSGTDAMAAESNRQLRSVNGTTP